MLNFKPIKWSWSPFSFSSNCLKHTLASFQTSCLRSKILSTLLIFSLDNGFVRDGMSTLYVLPSFSSFTHTCLALVPSCDLYKLLVTFEDFPTLGLFIVPLPKHWTFSFAVAVVALTQLIGCPFRSTIQPSTNHTIISLLVILLVPLIFQYISFFAFDGSNGMD